MAIPDFQTMMLPILEFFKDGKEHDTKGISAFIANYFNLSQEQLEEKVSSGTKRYISNLQWVVTYFRKAKLIENTKRGVYKLTERGKKLLDAKPDKIDIKTLRNYPEFLDFANTTREENVLVVEQEHQGDSQLNSL